MAETTELTTRLSLRGLWSRAGTLAPGVVEAKVLRRLGEGGSAEVFGLEVEGAVGERWALKLGWPDKAEVLLREAEVLSLVQGPGVPALEAVVSTPDGRVGLLMEWIDGPSLAGLPPDTAASEDVAREVWDSLRTVLGRLHELGFVHGDIRPENILLRERRPTVIDFGLSLGEDESSRARGFSAAYAAPELAVERRATALGDAYSLAKTLTAAFPRSRLDLGPWLEPRPERRAGLEGEQRGEEALSLAMLRVRRAFLAGAARELAADLLRSSEPRSLPEIGRVGARLRQAFCGLVKVDFLRLLLHDVPAPGLGAREPVALPPSAELSERLFSPLTLAERRRFLGFLVGPSALSLEIEWDDEQLWTRLLDFARQKPLRALTQAALDQAPSESARGLESVELALRLGGGHADMTLLEDILVRPDLPERLRLEAARMARRRDNSYLAHKLLDQLESGFSETWELDQRGPVYVERALVMRRQGRIEDAMTTLAALPEGFWKGGRGSWVGHALGIIARNAYDRGDLEAARAWAHHGAHTFACCEVLALLEIRAGSPNQALARLERGPVPEDDESRARRHGLLAMAYQSAGRSQEALGHFERAVEGAVRAGAVLEEATYLTGLAAAAVDSLFYDSALLAAERAATLFEVLRRKAQAARSLLVEAAVLSSLGAETELRERVLRATPLALEGGDLRCVGYLQLCLVDGLHEPSERLACLDEARRHLAGHVEDRLRVEARALELMARFTPDDEALVKRSEQSQVRVEWWRARALAARPGAAESREVVAEVLELCRGPRGFALGSAAVRAAELAVELGQLDVARKLLAHAHEVAELVQSRLPARHRERLESLPWVQAARAQKAPSFSEAQLGDVEMLLRALSHRDGLRPLFRQVLDLLLLWTGVERGILFLKAPRDQLRPRLGRNLRRSDLSREHLHVSESLARRALREGHAVTLTDALEADADLHRSVHFLNLRSVLAVPLKAGGETFGVVYLDDQARGDAFLEPEVAWASLIASIAGIAIRDARDRLLLRRARGRAERARARLEVTVEHREASIEVLERQLRDGERQPQDAEFGIVYESRLMHRLLAATRKVAQSDVPLLVLGESGSGKELIARAVHQAGRRVKQPFVAENCAALPETLLESELFGHVRGAFTGAARERAGLFEMADGGTLFLDEVGEMSLAMQAKLLRVLQDGTVRRVGSEKGRKVDVRVIAATHRSLQDLVREGRFRQDLFYRLDVVSLHVPPLRDRREDILPLARHFLTRYAPERVVRISPGAARLLVDFDWPGNIRQLENEVRRLLVFVEREVTASDLALGRGANAGQDGASGSLRDKVDALERSLVLGALDEFGGNKTKMAESLGVSRHGLLKMMKRLGLSENS